MQKTIECCDQVAHSGLQSRGIIGLTNTDENHSNEGRFEVLGGEE